MPWAPACKQHWAARNTLGIPKCRELRKSATLFTLTDKAVRFGVFMLGSQALNVDHHLACFEGSNTAMVIEQAAQLSAQGRHHAKA